MRLLIACLLASACKLAFAVKSLKLDIPKDQAVVIEVPPDRWTAKETSWAGEVQISVLRVDAAFIKSRGREDGSPALLSEFYLEKARDCGSGVTTGRVVGCPPNWKEIEFRSPKAWLKIQIAPDLPDIDAALKELCFIGSVAQFEATDYLHDKVFLPNQGKLFTLLPRLNQEDRYELFKLGLSRGFDMSSESFKGLTYVQVTVPVRTTFNTLRVPQNERVSSVIRDIVVAEAKRLPPYVDGKPVGGLAFHLSIPAYNFVTGSEAKFNNLAVYLATDQLKKFTESDITSQTLVNSSFVLLNNDRVEAKP